jgi:hypothetical protein
MATELPSEAQKAAQVIAMYDRRQEKAGMLVPFSDGMPYNRERVIQEAKFCLQVEIAARFEVGRRLLLLKENEGVHTCALILDEHFPGLSRRSAFNYMLFAKKAADLPKFRAWAEGKDNYSKALALMTELSEADLADFESEQSLLGLPKDKLDRLSVRELKDYIKKLKKQHDNELIKVGGDRVTENERLKKRLEALEAADEDVNRGRKLLEAGDKLLTDGLATLAKADFMLLRKDAAAVAIGRDLIAKVRRIADHLEAEMFPGAGR